MSYGSDIYTSSKTDYQSEVIYRREENKGYVSLFLTIKNKIYISVCCFKNMFITSFQGFHLIKTCEMMILLLIDTLLVLPATVVIMVFFITWYRSLYLSYFNER